MTTNPLHAVDRELDQLNTILSGQSRLRASTWPLRRRRRELARARTLTSDALTR